MFLSKHLILPIFLFLLSQAVMAQAELDERASIYNFKGVQFVTPDSSFYVNFRFRMQNRMGILTQSSSDLRIREVEARVRRLRMRVDGYIIRKELSYTIQLSFSRGDTDFDNSGIVNIIRDAIIFYQFSPRFYVAFGQSKLPGNRQRVNSSGQLQFADRSLVNSTFTLDRDFGLKMYYNESIGSIGMNFKAAVTTGEGRSVNGSDGGLAYTGRIEILPFGQFANGGDYSEGDLVRENSPKISVGGGFSYNYKAKRTGGQLGKELFEERTFSVIFADLIFKYSGMAYSAEYMQRFANSPITIDNSGNIRYIYTGWGINQQLSYLFNSQTELAFRYSFIKPEIKITDFELPTDIVEIGATKYFNVHRVKLQSSIYYLVRNQEFSFSNELNRWGARIQFELGI